MRNDMAQILVETPRHNGGEMYREHRRRANRNPEEAQSKQGMRKPYRERKEFGEYFTPLKGFLRKNVGRPWDKVFSELSASLTGGGTVIQHTKMHLLNDFVVLDPVWYEGVPHSPAHENYGPTPTPLNGEFYVDRRGILKKAPRVPRYRYQKFKPQRVPIDEHTAYHKIDGLWYRVWTKPLPFAGADNVAQYDIVLKKWVRSQGYKTFSSPEMVFSWSVGGLSGVWALERVHGSPRIAYRKEQVSARTIRREKLNEKIV